MLRMVWEALPADVERGIEGVLRRNELLDVLSMPKGDNEEADAPMMILRWEACEKSSQNGTVHLELFSPPQGSPFLPGWEFAWTGSFTEKQIERMSRILQWAASVVPSHTGIEKTHSVCFSRCREEMMELPTLRQKLVSLPVREIIFLEAEGDLTCLHHGHQGSSQILHVDLPLWRCEERLRDYGFLRVHRRYLVNQGCIRTWQLSGPIATYSYVMGPIYRSPDDACLPSPGSSSRKGIPCRSSKITQT